MDKSLFGIVLIKRIEKELLDNQYNDKYSFRITF